MNNFMKGTFKGAEYKDADEKNRALLKPLLMDEFIKTLGLSIQVIGWLVDVEEVGDLIDVLCMISDKPKPATSPFMY